MIDIQAIINKRVENCDNCGVENQSNPEEACDECIAEAIKRGRVIMDMLHPATVQVLDIRAWIKAGYPYGKEDLKPWQWKCLVAIDEAIEEKKTKEVERVSRSKS